MSEREACAIKDVAQLAPFGMGERTVVDKSVRDTWEMDASSVRAVIHKTSCCTLLTRSCYTYQVKIRNLYWPGFLSGVVEEVCKALGVDVAASCPRCDLYKLLLYETGSQ